MKEVQFTKYNDQPIGDGQYICLIYVDGDPRYEILEVFSGKIVVPSVETEIFLMAKLPEL